MSDLDFIQPKLVRIQELIGKIQNGNSEDLRRDTIETLTEVSSCMEKITHVMADLEKRGSN